MMKDAKCIALYGRRGSGKTTKARALMRGYSRVIVFDAVGEFAREAGFTSALERRDLWAAVKTRWRKGWKIAYQPGGSGDFAGELHRLSDQLWRVMAGYESGAYPHKVLLVVEEANLAFPSERLPADKRGFLRLVLQGRHRGIEIMAITQRPALIHPDFRGNVSETFCFALEDENDKRVIERKIGRDGGQVLRSLPNHSYLQIAGGDYKKGKNPPPK